MTFRRAHVAVFIPAHNEEAVIGSVVATVPGLVDHVIVVDDGSTDRTSDIVGEAACRDARVELVRLDKNRGVGAAVSAGIAAARKKRPDVVVTVDGDGQMSWDDLEHFVAPIVDGTTDIAKGNRLLAPRDWATIPTIRLLGNAALSLLTKIASGYWSIADSQSGYFAFSRYALDSIDWSKLYPRYGRENDTLVRANVAGCRVADVPIRPIYGVGERSGMRLPRVVLAVAFLLFRRFWWRMFYKYILRDFHPLVFFYSLAIVAALGALGMFGHLIQFWIAKGFISPQTALAVAFLSVTSLNSLFFAFWMDMQVNAPLAVRLPDYFGIRSDIEIEREGEADGAIDGSGSVSQHPQIAHRDVALGGPIPKPEHGRRGDKQ